LPNHALTGAASISPCQKKVSAKTLYRWVKGMRRECKLSQTALHPLLETLIDKCRVSDFEKGSICGVWESPGRLAEAIGVSTAGAE
jgi:hypothetical protein